MGTCDICGSSGTTTEVTVGNKVTGSKQRMDLCHDCAVKSAMAIKAAGGEVRFVDKKKSSGCMVMALGLLTAIAASVYAILA